MPERRRRPGLIRKAKLTVEAISKFNKGENVIASLAPLVGQGSRQHIIEVSYDLQAGSYTEFMQNPASFNNRQKWGEALAEILADHSIRSACEAGVGEASTLAPLAHIAHSQTKFYGFDISLSRLLYGREYARKNAAPMSLFCADILNIPFPDSSIDAVLTNQSMEPNGGQEVEMLTELLRVCGRYLIMVEPDYAMATPEQKERMIAHNYVRDIPRHLENFPGRIVRYEPWPFFTQAINKTSLIVFEKTDGKTVGEAPRYVSPVARKPLQQIGEYLFCADEGLLYPIAFGIPVLRDECAIICTHANQLVQGNLSLD